MKAIEKESTQIQALHRISLSAYLHFMPLSRYTPNKWNFNNAKNLSLLKPPELEVFAANSCTQVISAVPRLLCKDQCYLANTVTTSEIILVGFA